MKEQKQENKSVERVLKLEREAYISKKDGKEYYNYFVKGKIRGREIKVDFVVRTGGKSLDDGSKVNQDFGMHHVIDVVFSWGDVSAVDLVMEENSFTNDTTGEVVNYSLYYAYAKDEFGEYKAQVMPQRASDKALLEMLLAQKTA